MTIEKYISTIQEECTTVCAESLKSTERLTFTDENSIKYDLTKGTSDYWGGILADLGREISAFETALPYDPTVLVIAKHARSLLSEALEALAISHTNPALYATYARLNFTVSILQILLTLGESDITDGWNALLDKTSLFFLMDLNGGQYEFVNDPDILQLSAGRHNGQ